MEHVLFIVIGIGVFLLGVRDLCILILCTEQIEAEHTGYRTYYGGGRYGIQNVPYKKLTENMEHGNIHPIYINSKHPQTCIFLRKVRPDTILFLCMGLFIVLGAVMRMR